MEIKDYFCTPPTDKHIYLRSVFCYTGLDKNMPIDLKLLRMTGKGGVYLWNDLQSGNATIEDFIVELLEEGTQDDLYFKNQEEFYIEHLGTLWPNGYNGNKGNYIITTPETIAKSIATRTRNRALGLHRKSGQPGMAIYRYPDGTIKKLSVTHPDVVNNVVKHINYNPDCKYRILEKEIEKQKEKNNGLTDKQVAWLAKVKDLAKTYPNLESWKQGRKKFKDRMLKKDFTEKEKELYFERRPEIVKKQWAKLSNEEKEERTSPGLELMNSQYHCEHCGITTNKGNYHRWHGDKCKKVKK